MDSLNATPDLAEMDFLGLEISDLDITLSQVCEQIEKTEEVFQCLDKLSLTQMIEQYRVPMSEETSYGNFSLANEGDNLVKISKSEPLETFQRFADPVCDDDVKLLIEGQENPNTKKNTKWAVKVFGSWRDYYIESRGEMKDMSADELDMYLGLFIMEIRKKDGTPYPPKSLYLITCGLLRHLRDCGINDKTFLDTRDSRFCEFRKILDAKMKELLCNGYGTETKQAQPILPENEHKMWEKGVLGDKTAEILQCTMFFYSFKLFGLRGHNEHHDLQCEQFVVGQDESGKFVEFIGRQNKTFKGGLKHRELANKRIKHYCQEGDRCLADYFEKYLCSLGGKGHFYRRPLAGSPLRYGEQIVGINKLKNMMKVICDRAGLIGNYTNHSGKRTCATQLYIAGVDEQEIMARTGHRSEKGVRKYKQSCPTIQRSVVFVLDPPQPKSAKRKYDETTKMDIDQENVLPKFVKMSNSEKCETESRMCSPVLRDLTNGNCMSPYFANCNVTFHLK